MNTLGTSTTKYTVLTRSVLAFTVYFIVFICCLFIASVFLLIELEHLSSWLFLLLFLVIETEVILLSLYLAHLSSYARLQIVVLHDRLYFTWQKNYLFRARHSMEILFDDIVSCEWTPKRNILLHLKSGGSHTLRRRLFLVRPSLNFDDLFHKIQAGPTEPPYQPPIIDEPVQLLQDTNTKNEPHETLIIYAQYTSGWKLFFAFIVTFMVLILVIVLCVNTDLDDVLGFIALLTGLLATVFGIPYLIKRLLAQYMEITTTPTHLQIRYTRQPFFNSAANFEIPLSTITAYKMDTYQACILQLYQQNGYVFKATITGSDKKHSGEQAGELIISLIEHRKASDPVKLKRKDTLYEGRSGMALAVFFIIMIGLLLIGILFFPEEHEAKDVFMGLGYAITAMIMVRHIFNLRKRRKEAEQNQKDHPYE